MGGAAGGILGGRLVTCRRLLIGDKRLHEFFRNIYSPAHRHQPANGSHCVIWIGGLPVPTGKRSPERRFPHATTNREPSGSKPPYDVLRSPDAARESILQPRRP